MSSRSLLLALSVTTATLTAALAAALAAPPALAAHYYLALGDSLAAGFQAAPSLPDAGYVDDLYALRRRRQPDLQLLNIACLGTTTGTLISGDLCTHSAGPQLTQAVRFLHLHRGRVSLLTIDIGGNDIGAACGSGTSVTLPCVDSALAKLHANVTTIAHALRSAAGPHIPIAAMNYYDPGLAWWLQTPNLRALVPQTVTVVDRLNATLKSAYKSAGIPVADVATAFATHDLHHFTALAGHGRVPVAVANICRYTGACLTPQNNHATAAGYRVISRALELIAQAGGAPDAPFARVRERVRSAIRAPTLSFDR